MKQILTIVLALACSLAANAVTIEECLEKALERYPLLRQYEVLALTEKYTLEAAGRAWLPQVGISAQATWQSDVPAFPDALAQMLQPQGMRRDQYRAQVEVSQTIFDGGRIRMQKEKTRAEMEEQRAAARVEMYEVESRVEEVFFAILLLERQRDAVIETRRLLQENLRLMKALQEEGKALPSDCDAIEAELLSVKQQLAGIQYGERTYRGVLALYTGLMESVTLEKPKEKGVILSSPFLYHPEMQLFAAQEHSIAMQEREIRSQLLPTLGAFGKAFYGSSGLDYMDAMMSRDWKTGALVGVKLQWSVSSLYTRRPALERLKAQRDEVEIRRDIFRFGQNILLRQHLEEVRRLEEVMKSDRRIVELRQNVRQATESQLREGTVNTVLLLQRINDEHAARLASGTHEIERLRALYRSNHTSGK